jgi:hypothetical protein
MTVAPEVRAVVRAAYGYRCGYCGVSESWAGGELEVDHFRPLSRGGTDALDNLVYACTTCNRFKSDYWPDDDASDSFRLLHPRQDDLEAHILEAANGRLVGLTPRGWFHIRWLHLNRPQLIEMRQLHQSEQAIREALAQAQEVKTKLQERIRELELEVARLQEIISRLTEFE